MYLLSPLLCCNTAQLRVGVKNTCQGCNGPKIEKERKNNCESYIQVASVNESILLYVIEFSLEVCCCQSVRDLRGSSEVVKKKSSRRGSMARSDSASEDLMSRRDEERKQEPRKLPFKFLVQCQVRIGLRKQPVLRDRVVTVVLAAAILHGGYLVTVLYDVESK